MSVIIKKKNVETKVLAPSITEEADSLAEKVDQLGQMQREIASLEDKLKKDPIAKLLASTRSSFDTLKKSIVAEASTNLTPDEGTEVIGVESKLVIGKKAKKRTVTDVAGVHTFLGDEAFFKLATITLGNVDKYLTPSQVESVVSTSQSGSRSVKLKEV